MDFLTEKKEAIRLYKKHLKDLNKNKYLKSVFEAFAIVYLYNPFDKLSLDFKKKYFNKLHFDAVEQGLLMYLYPDYEIPKKDTQKAIKIVKEYINNFKKYAA